MRRDVTLLGSLLLVVACGSRGAEGAGTGDRRGVARGERTRPDLTRPTPATGASARGSLDLVVVVGSEQKTIGQNELAKCPEQGCLLSGLIALPAVARWCVDEPGAPASELSLETMKTLRVVSRKKGGVKLVAPGAATPLVRSPARIAPCAR